MNVSGDSNEKRDGLGLLVSVSFGASDVAGQISTGSPLGRDRARTDTELEVSCGLGH